ncbi:MAG TPA: DNA ligase D, partial [Longimicrobiales bacterium]|nr:DNA ligase D [Longimicrobiales bacterium]
RLLCRIEHGSARLFTRSGKDWTKRFGGIARAAAALPVANALLDGEAVVVRPDGTTDFQALQNRLDAGGGGDIVYYAFDLLHLDDRDLRGVPQLARKEAIEALLASAEPASVVGNRGAGTLRYSVHVVGRGPEVFEQACALGAEGIVAKRVDAPYRQGRSRDWLKVKCMAEQEFVVVGWTDPQGSRAGLGSLLLGYYDDGGQLRYAGRVGTGFTAKSLRELRRDLGRIARSTPPVTPAPRTSSRGVHWTEPEMVVEVAFTDWTRGGQLRHPSFKGRREDRDPREVRREQPVTGEGGRSRAANETSPASGAGVHGRRARKRGSTRMRPEQPRRRPAGVMVAGVRLTTPDRVYYPELGVTKRELADYYESVWDAMKPYIADRPLTIVRCPDGREAECFYQKHVMPGFPNSIRRVPVQEASRTRNYFAISDLASLVHLVQIGTLEFHTWGARWDRLDRPDVLVFDLDPGPGVEWAEVVGAAREVRDRLSRLGLDTFARTTGGKGIHVVAPLVRRHEWDEVKDFARAVASAMARDDPSLFTDRVAKEQRQRRIYVDYLRNARGATFIAAYSTRARPGATVAVPVSWKELTPRLDPASFTVRTVPGMVRERSRAWTGYDRVRQTITADMKKAAGLR